MTTGVGAVPITFAGLQGARQPATFLDRCFAYASAKVVQPQDFGAAGDNVTNDTAAVSSMTAATGSWRFTAATGYNVTAFTITANSSGKGDGRSSPVTISATGGISISGSNVSLDNLYVNGASSASIFSPSAGSLTDVSLRNLDLSSTASASPGGNGVNIGQASSQRWRLQGSNLSTYIYPFLVNASSVKGILCQGNFLTTAFGDAATINSPGTAAEDVIISGNVTNVTAGTGTASGFATGLAHVNGVVVMGNVSQRSFLEADHIEDGSKNTLFIGNIRKACQSFGIKHLVDGSNSAQAKAIQIIGNVYEAPSVTGANLSGINVAFTGAGSANADIIIGNVVRNFDYGISLGSLVMQVADGNTIDSCTYALRVDGNARVAGRNMVVGSSSGLLFVGLSTGNDVRVGKFVCDTKPTAIIVKAAPGTTRPGCSVEGFSWPQPNTALANGTNQVNLFSATSGTRISGKLRVVATNNATNADNLWYCADMTWDGTSIVLTNTLSEANGNLSVIVAPAITVSGGLLRIGIASVGAMTALVEVDFDGIYMQ